MAVRPDNTDANISGQSCAKFERTQC